MIEKKIIHEAIKEAQFAESVELIDVPTRGDGVILLRSRSMPACAFVVWAQRNTSTLSQMAFVPNVDQGDLDNRMEHCYSVTCACCPSETYGIGEISGLSEQEQKEWLQKVKLEFRDQLIRICQNNGVKIIFMRSASAWERHYGSTGGLIVFEAIEHLSLLLAMYPRDLVKKELRFIDYRRSGGMEDYVNYREL